MGKEHYGKRRNCSLRAISPFPIVFSKDFYCRHEKNTDLFGKGLNLLFWLQRFFLSSDLNEDGELELLDSDIKDLKRTNMMEESQIIKMKAELACMEGKVGHQHSIIHYNTFLL